MCVELFFPFSTWQLRLHGQRVAVMDARCLCPATTYGFHLNLLSSQLKQFFFCITEITKLRV